MKLSEIPIEPTHTQADIDVGLDWLTANRPSAKYNGVFASIKGGKVLGCRTNGPCHGNQQEFIHHKPSVFVTVTHPKEYCNVATYSHYSGNVEGYDQSATESFLTWCFTESHWSRWVLNPDVQSIINLGVVFTTDVPASLMAAMLMMTRHNRERHRQVRYWDSLVKAGWNPYLAYVAAFNTSRYKSSESLANFDFGANVEIYSTGSEHTIFDSGKISELAVRNFCSGVVADEKASDKWLEKNYREVYRLFDYSGRTSSKNFFDLVMDGINAIGKEETLTKLPCPFGNYKKDNGATKSISRARFDGHGKEIMEKLFL